MAELRAYHPTLRDKIAMAILGDRRASSPLGDLVGGLIGSTGLGVRGSSLSDFTPAGPVFSADEAVRSAGEGDYKGAALNAAGAIPFGGLGAMARYGRRAAKPLENLASRSAFMYDPPVKMPRAFGDDYPGGGVADASGKLAFDIEGRPLVARDIAGRKRLGGPDEAIPAARLDPITEGITGQTYQGVPAAALPRGTVGSYRVGYAPDGNVERSILYRRDASEDAAPKIVAHEVGHAIDDLAGRVANEYIPQKGLKPELNFVYNDLNNPARAQYRQAGRDPDASKWKALSGFLPKNFGYATGAISDRELMAEAIRAYMASPNYLKTVAPKTAARIREFVNSNPKLMHTIQFNTLLGGVVGGAMAGSDRANSSEDRHL